MPARRPEKERFWEKVEILGPDDCWEWLASRNPKGYGQFRSRNSMGHIHSVLAHRYVVGLPELHVLHRCDNPPCCNPKHLFIGSQAENVLDRDRKGRGRQPKGEENGRARLTEEVVRSLRAGVVSIKEVMIKYGMSESAVGHAKAGRNWRHVV